MNVLFAVPWDNIGGVSHVVNRVAHHMRAKGHGVFVLLPGPEDRVESDTSREGFPVVRLRLRPPCLPGAPLRHRIAYALALPVTLLQLVRLVRRLRIDVVNIHFPGGQFAYFETLRRLGVVRLVTSIHGADLLPNGRRNVARHQGFADLLTSSDVLVAPSASYYRAVQAEWPELTGPARAIPNGVDPAELGYDASRPDETATPPVIFSILQMVHYKGPDVLIQAFAALAASYPDVRLRLASDGPQRAEYEALAASLGVGDRVEFLGLIDRETVSLELRRCSVFVLPSRTNSESFGIAAAEAMALDRAVVASRVGGLPELIEDAESGLLVEPGDVAALEQSLRRLLDDAGLRQRLGRAAGQRIRRHFLWERTGALYEELFQALVTTSQPQTGAPDGVSADRAAYSVPAQHAHAGTTDRSVGALSHAGVSQEEW